jgi:hypothetical protein
MYEVFRDDINKVDIKSGIDKKINALFITILIFININIKLRYL